MSKIVSITNEIVIHRHYWTFIFTYLGHSGRTGSITIHGVLFVNATMITFAWPDSLIIQIRGK
jgi:hypothetical protein